MLQEKKGPALTPGRSCCAHLTKQLLRQAPFAAPLQGTDEAAAMAKDDGPQ